MLTGSYNGWDYLREIRDYHLSLSRPFPKIQVRNTSNIYQNNVIALIGINASGKTIVLNLVSFVLNLLSANQINNAGVRDVLSVMTEEDRLKLEVFFYDDGNINDLSIEIGVDKSGTAPSYDAYMDFKRFLREELK